MVRCQCQRVPIMGDVHSKEQMMILGCKDAERKCPVWLQFLLSSCFLFGSHDCQYLSFLGLPNKCLPIARKSCIKTWLLNDHFANSPQDILE